MMVIFIARVRIPLASNSTPPCRQGVDQMILRTNELWRSQYQALLRISIPIGYYPRQHYSRVWLKGQVEFSNCPFKSLAEIFAPTLSFKKNYLVY
jgi:hypothetical protein